MRPEQGRRISNYKGIVARIYRDNWGRQEIPNLAPIFSQPAEDIMICCLGKATAFPGRLVIGIPLTEPLRAVIETISKRMFNPESKDSQ